MQSAAKPAFEPFQSSKLLAATCKLDRQTIPHDGSSTFKNAILSEPQQYFEAKAESNMQAIAGMLIPTVLYELSLGTFTGLDHAIWGLRGELPVPMSLITEDQCRSMTRASKQEIFKHKSLGSPKSKSLPPPSPERRGHMLEVKAVEYKHGFIDLRE